MEEEEEEEEGWGVLSERMMRSEGETRAEEVEEEEEEEEEEGRREVPPITPSEVFIAPSPCCLSRIDRAAATIVREMSMSGEMKRRRWSAEERGVKGVKGVSGRWKEKAELT